MIKARYSKEFGTKEKVLNYACQTYQLSRPSKVGAVMALIRECQPTTYKEWENFYFENAYTTSKDPTKITKETLTELGERLYCKITEIVKPEWLKAFNELAEQDCIDYIYNLTLNRTYDGYLREKSVVNDGLAKEFPSITFEETDPELDHAGDIDYMGRVGDKYIGIQIKPITASSNFSTYKPSERMQKNFDYFKDRYGGSVFIVYSQRGEIANIAVLDEIRAEIKKLTEPSNEANSGETHSPTGGCR